MQDLLIPNLHELGQDGGRGNILGIEPYMVQQDYASREAFLAKLESYLALAKDRAWINARTIVLFPEYIGTWLALAGEGAPVFRAVSLEAAERAMALRHWLEFARGYLAAKEKGKAEAAFFRMKASEMTEIYSAVFGQLAKDYAVTIVAGSIVLPSPAVIDEQLTVRAGPLQNISVVFAADGRPSVNLIRKSFPTAAEQPFTIKGSAEENSAFDSPAGRLGVMICADSWYPQAYAALKTQKIDLLAVPSYDVSGMEKWNQIWRGYDGWPMPSDADSDDVQRLKESEAWKKYALAGRIASSGARFGMNVFMRGRLWDQDLGGWPATLVRDGEVFVEPQTRQPALLTIWL